MILKISFSQLKKTFNQIKETDIEEISDRLKMKVKLSLVDLAQQIKN